MKKIMIMLLEVILKEIKVSKLILFIFYIIYLIYLFLNDLGPKPIIDPNKKLISNLNDGEKKTIRSGLKDKIEDL